MRRVKRHPMVDLAAVGFSDWGNAYRKFPAWFERSKRVIFNGDHSTPLHLAVSIGSQEMAKILLEQGSADIKSIAIERKRQGRLNAVDLAYLTGSQSCLDLFQIQGYEEDAAAASLGKARALVSAIKESKISTQIK